MSAGDKRLTEILPSARQLALQELEFYAFIHFTVNTFTDKEWGDGTESPSIFDPAEFDARKWVSAVKAAGMKGLILTCKHHDGFCLWQTRYTRHSVASSPFRNGRGDIVREVSDACREGGIRFGIYLSPWDRNSHLYGAGKAYDDYFVNQLTELLTGYGEIFDVWLDGACGEGKNGKKQFYDWDRYYAAIRRLQPNACISVCGPDIRWCGNEAGQARKAEWSVVPKRTSDTEKIASLSQQADSAEFRQRSLSASDEDLGSRERLKNESELIWYPAEVNTSIRPGWFYHKSEDDSVKPLAELRHVYIASVGGNATFLLNIPPMPNGLFSKQDEARLAEMGDWLRRAFSDNLILRGALLTADSEEAGHGIENAKADDYSGYYIARDDKSTAEITIQLPNSARISYVVLKEYLMKGQRIESFSIALLSGGEWKTVYKGTVVGHKRIAEIGGASAQALKIRITDSRLSPTLSFIGVY
ncbi:MAG: alpha-L-fucosidase [Eubacteriales bacterium]|nr:alpha-L-fucosidase [Eubacteriales bacterium]MDD3881309.1 alpha-L-fucosidase [Eubacteriales bacterium]MDD4512227.1 alpha-L-fucosidase [Eubacteriales bacterium]